MNELTIKEFAEKLGISLRQVQTLIQRNRLPATKKGRDWFVLERDLELVRERKKTDDQDVPEKMRLVKFCLFALFVEI